MSPSSFTVFARKVRGSGWNKRLIRRKLLKQVEKDDYAKADVSEILSWLAQIALSSTKWV